jgi:glycerol kinase
MKPLLMALDEGTSSARTLLFDRQGQVQATAQTAFAQHYPEPGWVEHDAQEIWRVQLQNAHQALERAQASPAQVAAIGITNQRETTVVWDRRTGQPIHPAIVWQDRRTADFCAQLRAQGAEPLVQQRTGLLLDPYFSGTKIRWILDHVNGARHAAGAGHLAFGTIDTWLIWQLTEGRVHATDPSNASRTLLYNIQTSEWDPELLSLLGIPASMLPQVRPSAADYGHTTLLGGQIAITGVVGDQQAATFGQACFAPGTAKNTYGTGCFILLNTGTQAVQSQHRLLTTVAWQLGPETTYALEGSVFSAGATLQWLRDLGLYQTVAEMEALLAEAPDSQGVYLVPAFAGLGAPHWDPQARGTLLGLTRGSGRGQLLRAALEAMAYQSDEVLQAMIKDSCLPLSALRVDGGVARNDSLLQFQADLSATRIERPQSVETTALGAAWMAGIGAGVYQNTDELSQLWQAERSFAPARDAAWRGTQRATWQRATDRALGWEP